MGWRDYVSDVGIPAGVASVVSPMLAPVGAGLGWMQHRAQGAASDAAEGERIRLQQAQAQRDANIARLREIYGIGTSQTAQTNKMSIDDAIKQYYQSLLKGGSQQAQDRYSDLTLANRQNLARRGNTGGSVEGSVKAKTLSQYLLDRQNAIAKAASQSQSLRSSLDTQRTGIESGLQSGSIANPDFSSYIANRENTLRSANANVIPAAIGQELSTAGGIFKNGMLQGAYGNQGNRIFTSGSGGTIS